LVSSFLEIFFLLKLFHCISLSLFHLFPFLFYSFAFLLFFWFIPLLKGVQKINLCTLLWDRVIFQILINCLKMLHSSVGFNVLMTSNQATFWFRCAFYDPRRNVNCTWIKNRNMLQEKRIFWTNSESPFQMKQSPVPT
jgi:hypothetical protein